MTNVDIKRVIKEGLEFDTDDYIIRVPIHTLWKFGMKMYNLPEESRRQAVTKWVTDKMRNKNEYYLEELENQSRHALVEAILKYMEDYLWHLDENEVMDTVEVIEKYQFDLEKEND